MESHSDNNALEEIIPKVDHNPGSAWEATKLDGSSHYKTGAVEPIDLIRSAGYLEGFALGNIIKYAVRIGRRRNRDKLSDLKKISHYSRLLSAHLEGRE